LYLGILVERERGGDVLLFVLSFRRKSLRWKNPGRILAPGERERERERERYTHTGMGIYIYTHRNGAFLPPPRVRRQAVGFPWYHGVL